MSIFTISNLVRTLKNTSEGLSRFAETLESSTASANTPQSDASSAPTTDTTSDTSATPEPATPAAPEPVDTLITQDTIGTLVDYLYATSGTTTRADVLMPVSVLPSELRSQLTTLGGTYYSSDNSTLIVPGLDLTLSPDNKAIVGSTPMFAAGVAMKYAEADTMVMSPMIAAIVVRHVDPDHLPENFRNNVTPKINDLLARDSYDAYDRDADDYVYDDDDEYYI